MAYYRTRIRRRRSGSSNAKYKAVTSGGSLKYFRTKSGAKGWKKSKGLKNVSLFKKTSKGWKSEPWTRRTKKSLFGF